MLGKPSGEDGLTSVAPTILPLLIRLHLHWLLSDFSKALAASGPFHSSFCLKLFFFSL